MSGAKAAAKYGVSRATIARIRDGSYVIAPEKNKWKRVKTAKAVEEYGFDKTTGQPRVLSQWRQRKNTKYTAAEKYERLEAMRLAKDKIKDRDEHNRSFESARACLRRQILELGYPVLAEELYEGGITTRDAVVGYLSRNIDGLLYASKDEDEDEGTLDPILLELTELQVMGNIGTLKARLKDREEKAEDFRLSYRGGTLKQRQAAKERFDRAGDEILELEHLEPEEENYELTDRDRALIDEFERFYADSRRKTLGFKDEELKVVDPQAMERELLLHQEQQQPERERRLLGWVPPEDDSEADPECHDVDVWRNPEG